MNAQVRVAVIGAIGAIIVAIITAIVAPVIIKSFSDRVPIPTSVPSIPTPTSPQSILTPTPAQSIPRLHDSYTGELDNQNGATVFAISSLVEKADGSFTAAGTEGLGNKCSGEMQGTVYADNTIDFIFKEDQGTNCGTIVQFTGQVYRDGHLAGTWKDPVNQTNGNWNAY